MSSVHDDVLQNGHQVCFNGWTRRQERYIIYENNLTLCKFDRYKLCLKNPVSISITFCTGEYVKKTKSPTYSTAQAYRSRFAKYKSITATPPQVTGNQ